jgi:hypothetical protein
MSMTASLSDGTSGPPDIKLRTGRPPRRKSQADVQAVEYYLSRCARYGREVGYDGQPLRAFAIGLAMWRELSKAGVPSPVLSEVSAYRLACLAEKFEQAEDELEDDLGRPARNAELASYVASWYRSRDPLYSTAMKQGERLQDEARAREYWTGVPAEFVEHEGLRVGRAAAEAFWSWYRNEFHGEDEKLRPGPLAPEPVTRLRFMTVEEHTARMTHCSRPGSSANDAERR